MRHTSQPRSATRPASSGSKRSALTSLTSVAPGQPADHPFPGQADQQRHAEGGELVERAQQRKIVLERLAEAESRIDDDALLLDAGHLAGEDALGEKAAHVGHDIAVVRVVLHRARLAEHVHQADRDLQRRNGIERTLAPQRAYVVDEAGAGGHRGAHDLGLARVDRDRQRRLPRQRFDDRHDAGYLLGRGDLVRARPRRLAADVEQVGALVRQALPVSDRRRRIDEAPAIGKRIRRDVDDARDAGPVEAQRPAGTVEGGDEVEHAQSGDGRRETGDGRREEHTGAQARLKKKEGRLLAPPACLPSTPR